ncbi:hypothetical protein HPB49_013352 [Dermacentor silvarum]|uniref:Uncharacterized protein n=1 Tax=Dermacentor silvarum TaxID=543639 RepID=A0ACB8DPX4_DERSI|nr:hypothetical protein HPB49_013352 [Dermacentor silvarum]
MPSNDVEAPSTFTDHSTDTTPPIQPGEVETGTCVLLLVDGAHFLCFWIDCYIKMADNSVNVHVEQCVVMKFLVNEGIKPAEICRRLQAQYGDETLSSSKTFE